MKAELREQAKKNRDKMPSPQKAVSLRDNFNKNVEIPPSSIISFYWPIGSEIDVRPLMQSLYEKGHNVCLPCIVAPDSPLNFREWEPGAVLVKSKFGIYEPCRQHHNEVTPNVMIVPLLAFDAARHRLGYGGGYYDRTIQKLRKDEDDLLAYGVAFDEQRIAIVPAEEWDVKLDKIITESKVF